MVRGENAVTIDFVSGDDALNRSDDLLYTLFVPARAHLAFPCFDQPDLKARYTLSVTVPAAWQVAANGRQTGEQDAPSQPGFVTHRFAETKPLSTYLFAFAAGRFSVETAVRGGRQMRMFHRETDAAKVARNRDSSSICMRRRWPGWRTTPPSRIHSTPSTSCSFRRSSSAGWNMPARSSTTRRA
jgi:aminopeptidase N